MIGTRGEKANWGMRGAKKIAPEGAIFLIPKEDFGGAIP